VVGSTGDAVSSPNSDAGQSQTRSLSGTSQISKSTAVGSPAQQHANLGPKAVALCGDSGEPVHRVEYNGGRSWSEARTAGRRQVVARAALKAADRTSVIMAKGDRRTGDSESQIPLVTHRDTLLFHHSVAIINQPLFHPFSPVLLRILALSACPASSDARFERRSCFFPVRLPVGLSAEAFQRPFKSRVLVGCIPGSHRGKVHQISKPRRAARYVAGTIG
jgi:hypothetical protein